MYTDPYYSLDTFSRRQIGLFFFYFFPGNRLWHFMQIVSWRQFAWSVKAYFLGKKLKSSKMSSAEFFTQHVKH